MPLDLLRYRQQLAQLADQEIFIGTSWCRFRLPMVIQNLLMQARFVADSEPFNLHYEAARRVLERGRRRTGRGPSRRWLHAQGIRN